MMAVASSPKEGFEGLKSLSNPKERNSIIKFSTQGEFPNLEEHDRDIEGFRKDFNAMARLSNGGRGMNPVEEIKFLKQTVDLTTR
jgi:hypothetical protein